MNEIPDVRTTTSWAVVWFPPEGDRKKRCSSEAVAREFAASEHVAEWNPLLEQHITTVSNIVTLVDL